MIQLSHHLQFRNQDQGQLSREQSCLVQSLSNPTVNTDLTFEFKFKDENQNPAFVYMQARVAYLVEGRRLLRVITRRMAAVQD